jgi:hypothetical protein
MVFNSTFYDISVVSWRSVLLVEETGVNRENHRPAVSHWQTFFHTYSVYLSFITDVKPIIYKHYILRHCTNIVCIFYKIKNLLLIYNLMWWFFLYLKYIALLFTMVDMIKFVSDLRQVCGFLCSLRFPPPYNVYI